MKTIQKFTVIPILAAATLALTSCDTKKQVNDETVPTETDTRTDGATVTKEIIVEKPTAPSVIVVPDEEIQEKEN
jgi:hypothetical protein